MRCECVICGCNCGATLVYTKSVVIFVDFLYLHPLDDSAGFLYTVWEMLETSVEHGRNDWMTFNFTWKKMIFKSLVFQKSRIFGPGDFQHPTFWAQCLLQNKPASRTLKWAEGFERNKKAVGRLLWLLLFLIRFSQLRFLNLWGFPFSKIVSANLEQLGLLKAGRMLIFSWLSVTAVPTF